MKKIAFYVEGVTEQLFINKLLIEIAGHKKIAIELCQFQGAGRNYKRDIYPKTTANSTTPMYYALIFDCKGDGGVKPRILEDHPRLFAEGYTEIIGLLDLYPKTDLAKFQEILTHGTTKDGQQLTPPLPAKTEIIIAVNEVETWFLSECAHFICIDSQLTEIFIQSAVGFNPCTDDMTLRHHPAEDLHKIYQLVNQSYMDSNGKKRKNYIEKTVECLDYANIYTILPRKIIQLERLISKIDNYLS